VSKEVRIRESLGGTRRYRARGKEEGPVRNIFFRPTRKRSTLAIFCRYFHREGRDVNPEASLNRGLERERSEFGPTFLSKSLLPLADAQEREANEPVEDMRKERVLVNLHKGTIVGQEQKLTEGPGLFEISKSEQITASQTCREGSALTKKRLEKAGQKGG